MGRYLVCWTARGEDHSARLETQQEAVDLARRLWARDHAERALVEDTRDGGVLWCAGRR